MCGIIGYSGQQNINKSELKALLLMAQNRGSDSTGLATPDGILKQAVPADEFIGREDFPTDQSVIGHTRAKTTGKVCDKNSHPFQSGQFTGVHNGYISNFYTLRSREGKMGMEVDSEIIWYVLNEYGLQEGIPKLQGSFALAWLDEDRNLNLYRHRMPIVIGFKEDNLYFGSKDEYLRVIGCENIQSLNEHFHYIISEGRIVEETDLTDYKPKKRTYNGNSYYNKSVCGYQRGGSDTQSQKSGQKNPYKPVFAPDNANYVQLEDGPVVYYWFTDTSYTKLIIEPCYIGIEYEWKEDFNLDKKKDVKLLEKNYPNVYNAKDIQNIIKTQAV